MLRRLVLSFFNLLYNELAWSYDLVSVVVSMGQWRSWQRAALRYLPAGDVLEVGHGTGSLLLDLARGGYQPVGLDLSPPMGTLAQRKLRRALGDRAAAIPLLRASVYALPLAQDTLPSLLSTFPTDYIRQPAAINEFYRVLAPGGVFVCVPAAQITGLSPTDRFAEWLFRVTGQAAAPHGMAELWGPLLQRFTAAGFAARLEQVRLPRSVVTLVVAHKAPSRTERPAAQV